MEENKALLGHFQVKVAQVSFFGLATPKINCMCKLNADTQVTLFDDRYRNEHGI